MRLADGSGLKLIDFEYAAPLDPAYDIANHFNEWMYPYLEPEPHLYDEALYPTPHEQAHFCRAYLEGGGDSGGAAGESAVAALVAEVNSRRRDSHAYWVDWAARMQPRTAFNEAYGLARRQLLERGTREAADEQLLGANSRETGVHT
jgi:thiamine kinase-like enzyme